MMINQTMRDARYTARLTDFIRREYDLAAISILPAKRGYYGETWRLNTGEGSYFIKIVYNKAHKPLYERSFPVIAHMNRHGIDFISKIKRAANGSLYTHFDKATVGLFDWIEGENVQNERTKLQEYTMLAKIYTIPTQGLDVPHDTFHMGSAELFYKQWDELKQHSDGKSSNIILGVLDLHKEKIENLRDRLKLFSEQCKTDLSHRYITHGDAGGNVMINGDRAYIVDWDDPAIAPPERDAWFCLHWDWATNGFNDALRKNGIDYTLRLERLAYYCYHSFFWYLTNYMATFFEFGDLNGELSAEMADYLQNGWINDNIAYANAHFCEDNYGADDGKQLAEEV